MSETKIIHYPARERPFAPEELDRIFGQLGKGHEVVLALRQILQQRLARATGDVADDRLTERQAGHAAGRIAEISDLHDELTQMLERGGSATGRRVKRLKD